MEGSEKTFNKAFTTAIATTPEAVKNSEVTADIIRLNNMVKNEGEIESNEATGSGSAGQFSGPLFSSEKMETTESKDSNLRNKIEKLLKDKLKRDPTKEEIDSVYVKAIKKLYDKTKDDLKKIEATEATGSGSVGAYETPAAWAKSTKKKDWRGASKTQIPGGAFVSVKKKCTKFPYCNKGDINALHIYKNKSLKEAIQQVSIKTNLSETTIKAIIQYEVEKLSQNK